MTTKPNLPPLPDDGYPSTMEEIHKVERARRPTVKIEPGSELHMALLMSPWHLQHVTGQDYAHLVAYGQAAYQAGRDAERSACINAVRAVAHRGGTADDCDSAIYDMKSDAKGGV